VPSTFKILRTPEARADLAALAANKAKQAQYKAALKAIALLQSNPKHPGLHTHKMKSLAGPNGEDLFTAYAQNNTPDYRVFWHYGPDEVVGLGKQAKRTPVITIVSVEPHS
jgi:hypothetical protein